MNEAEAIERLRKFATDPAARGLADDAALFEGLVITHDSIAERVHFLSDDPPASVGWKLVAVNLSDLAGKGATPAAAVLSLTASLGAVAAPAAEPAPSKRPPRPAPSSPLRPAPRRCPWASPARGRRPSATTSTEPPSTPASGRVPGSAAAR